MKTAMLNLAVILLLAGCAKPQTAQTESGQLLNAMTSKWEQAFNNNDMKALGALYAKDAIMMPPNAPPQVGREAIVAGQANDASVRIELNDRESLIAGNLGFKRGEYIMKAGNETVDEGKYLEIWKKIDGQWLIHRDIYNSNRPAATE